MAMPMMLGRLTLVAVLAVPLGAVAQPEATPPPGWPDRSLDNWNQSGAPIPRANALGSLTALAERCPPAETPTTGAATALRDAGWLPFFYFDRPLVADDVEVLGGMLDGDVICRPMHYNLFVFVRGRFAGTLSPQPMHSRADLSSGTVRLLADAAITVEITRYGPTDPPCCPSSRDTVRFVVDRTADPVVKPISVRRTRGGGK